MARTILQETSNVKSPNGNHNGVYDYMLSIGSKRDMTNFRRKPYSATYNIPRKVMAK